MLQKLTIKNYAIIDYLVLEPDPHLNIVTGETGAGKSIILGALSLILGDRVDSSALINKSEKCVIEAFFNVADNYVFKKALQEEDLDDDGNSCIIRREISTAGKSRAFINDTPVNLSVLNKLTALLVDLQQQFGHLELRNDDFQLEVVDAMAKIISLRNEYTNQYYKYVEITKQLSDKQALQKQWQSEVEYKQYILDELTNAAFKENEIEDIESQLKQLSSAERIINILQSVRYSLDESEKPIINELRILTQQLQQIADVLPASDGLLNRLTSVHAELKDIYSELSELENKISLDPEKLQELQDRLDLAYKLLKKHSVKTTEELLAIQTQLENDLQANFNLDDEIEQLTKSQVAQYNSLIKLAKELSKSRHTAKVDFEENMNKLLYLVGMPNAVFKVAITERNEPGVNGIDDISFLLDANKSGQFQPIHRTASGGEMSRITLCIKSLVAKTLSLPTLIFDEVDTGISGEAARQVALLLQDLAKYHQIICITHQPQVAAKGTKHLYVYKEPGEKDKITTKIRSLEKNEIVVAIARMLGGGEPSDAAVQNAKELISN